MAGNSSFARNYLRIPGSLKSRVTIAAAVIEVRFFHFVRVRKLRRAAAKRKLRVVFVVVSAAMWKLDSLYWHLVASAHFEPVVVVVPHYRESPTQYMNLMCSTLAELQAKGIHAESSWDEARGSWRSLSEFKPDLLWFTTHWDTSASAYNIWSNRRRLTLYSPYAFGVFNIDQAQYGQKLHRLVWRAFYETEFHKNTALQVLRLRAGKVCVTGYLGIDRLLDRSELPSDADPWPTDARNRKRVVWAPHWTVDSQVDGMGFSTFLTLAPKILELVHQFSDEIVFCLKPHPILRSQLEQIWGIESARNFFVRWEKLDNAFIWQGDYEELFVKSDALIHDCGSFTAEYLAVNKPVLHLSSTTEPLHYGAFGFEALACHYRATTEEDVRRFLFAQVIFGDDPKRAERVNFIREKITPPNSKVAALNVLRILERALELDED